VSESEGHGAVVHPLKRARSELARLWRERRRLVLAICVGVLALFVIGGLIAYEALKRPPDVHNPDATFEPEKPKKQRVKTVSWPMYGYDRARTRYLPAKGVKPPFRKIWRYTDRPLLEFPPVLARGRLYLVDNSGHAVSLDADTGKVLWTRRIGHLNASSPTFHKNRLYVVNLVPGHVIKLDARTGRTIWKRSLPGRAESSPVVVGRTLYFGCENGELIALSTRNGNERWSTSLGGAVKSAPAYYGGVLYVGDYGGYMNAVDARTGGVKWQSDSLGQGFGTSGAFYSTPAVAFGRVYAGNNDSRVYSFDRKDGTIAWTYSTGGYAYSGPAVANTRHTRPTVYIGSFDGNVYALDAKDGEPRWIQSAGGQVIGSLTAIGDIVYVAEFSDTSTTGFSMRTGKVMFRYPRGTYTPLISDGRRVYLVGYSSVTALQPYKYKAALSDQIVAPEPPPQPPKSKRRSKPKPERDGKAKKAPKDSRAKSQRKPKQQMSHP
jgi:outer membrane protein assembly factor BamB